jgi:hypothetical protein
MNRARNRKPAGACALLVAVWIGALFAHCGGCASDPTRGYASMTVFRDDVRTVAVPIFENDTFTRDVEFDLTEALIKEIESRTPYKVVDRARADTILIGHVRQVELDQLSKSQLTGLSEEVILSVSIDFQWQHQQTGQLLLERREFEGQGLFVPSRPSGEPIELGRYAAVQQLARDIVNEMQSPW